MNHECIGWLFLFVKLFSCLLDRCIKSFTWLILYPLENKKNMTIPFKKLSLYKSLHNLRMNKVSKKSFGGIWVCHLVANISLPAWRVSWSAYTVNSLFSFWDQQILYLQVATASRLRQTTEFAKKSSDVVRWSSYKHWAHQKRACCATKVTCSWAASVRGVCLWIVGRWWVFCVAEQTVMN